MLGIFVNMKYLKTFFEISESSLKEKLHLKSLIELGATSYALVAFSCKMLFFLILILKNIFFFFFSCKTSKLQEKHQIADDPLKHADF